MSLLDMIKRTAIGAHNSTNPVNVLYGKVTKASPLEIEIHQKLTLTKEFLVLTERVTKHEIDLSHTHSLSGQSTSNALSKITIRPGLAKGDKVVLLRVQGGHQFVVLDKVVG